MEARAWATSSALRMSPPPHASAHRIAWRPWQLHNRPLSLVALSHTGLVSRVQPVLRDAWAWSRKGWASPSFGLCAWHSAWCEGDPKGLTVSRCEDAHVRVMCAHA